MVLSYIANNTGSGVDQALQGISHADGEEVRTDINRVTFAIETHGMAMSNEIISEGHLTGADVASDIATLMRSQVLEQASISILAQANVSSNVVLDLLG